MHISCPFGMGNVFLNRPPWIDCLDLSYHSPDRRFLVRDMIPKYDTTWSRSYVESVFTKDIHCSISH